MAGFGVHWYNNRLVPPTVLTATHESFPDRFILATEACNGFCSAIILKNYCIHINEILFRPK